ncbi:MAG TPA: PAS domain S-box protein [Bacteroidota bacterium]|jgi:PAS domain S-box-containing protein
MPRKFFSTGLPRLDQAIGNVTPGDVLLSLISSEGERRDLIQPLSEYSSSMQIPVLYLAADDSPCEELRNAYRLKSLTFAGPKSQSSPGAIGRAVKKWGKGRYIVLEDLSAWKALLRSERRVVELFRLLSKIASEQRSVLIASALKPGLGLDTLGLLKDSATACLDFNTYKQDLFCSLIALRGKYLPGGSIPFRFEPKDLSRPPSRTDEPVEAIPNEAQGNRMRALEGSVFPATSAYQEVFRRAQEAMFLFALDGGYREANAELERAVGYSEDELRILNPLTLISPAHRIRFLRFLAEFRKKKKGRVDVDLIRKNGKTLQVELSAGKLDHGIYLGIIRDAGPRLQMEREHDQLRKLAASEAQNRELVERTSAALAMIEDGKYFYVNRAFLDLFGYEAVEEIVGKEYTRFQEDPELSWLKEGGTRKDLGGEPLKVVRFRGLRKDGGKVEIEAAIVPFKHVKGRTLVYLRDITRETLAGEEVRRRLEEQKLLREVVPSGAVTADIPKMLRSSLANIMDVLGWQMGALYSASPPATGVLKISAHRGLPATILKTLDTLERDTGLGGFVTKTLAPHLFQIRKYPSHLPFRALWKEAGVGAICLIPLVSRERLVGILLLCSKREEREERYSPDLLSAIGHQLGSSIETSMIYNEIKAREEEYAALIAGIPDVLYIGSPGGSIEFISPGVERLVGYAQREFYRNKTLWLSLIHPDDKKLLLEATIRGHSDGTSAVREYRVRPKGKASYRWVRDTMKQGKEGEQGDARPSGIITDITDERLREESAGADARRRDEIVSKIEEGVFAYDRQLRCLQWNRGMEEITGLSPEEVAGRPAAETLPGYDDRDLSSLLSQVLEGQTVRSDGISYEIPRTGKKGILRGSFSPLRDASGSVTGLMGIVTDVTFRKKLETDLRESEQVLRNIIDTMADILIITDLEGKLLQVNKPFVELLGYPRAEALGLSFPYPWLVEEEMGRYVTWISNLRDRNWLHDFDMTWKGKAGHSISVSLSTTLLRNSMGEPVAMLNIARDITERARLTKDLEHRNKQIEMINRVIGTANQTMNFEVVFAAVVKEINDVLASDMIDIGLVGDRADTLVVFAAAGTRSSLKGSSIPLGKTITQFALRENRPVVVNDLAADPKLREMASLAKGLRSQIAIPIRLKGQLIGALNIGSSEPYAFSEEHVGILEPLAQELGSVIDRVNLFRQVSDDAAYVHTLLNSIDSIVYTVDPQCRIREGNKAWHEYLRECGMDSPADGVNPNLFDFLPDPALKLKIQAVVDQLLAGSIRFFSEEHTVRFPARDRVYQLTINPMLIGQRITGLVFAHVDITEVKHAEEVLKRNNEQLLALNEISALASTSLRIEDILEGAVPLLKKAMEADVALVYLRETEGTDLLLVKQSGFDESVVPSISRLTPSDSVTGKAVERNTPTYISEKAYQDQRVIPKNRELLRATGLDAMAIIPLASKEVAQGALNLLYRQPHGFPEQERRLLSLVGNQLGAAIENARLYAQLREQIDRLTALYELSQELTSTLDIDQIFLAVCESSERIVPYEEFRIDFYDPSTETSRPAFRVRVAEGERIVMTEIAPPAPVRLDSAKWSVLSTKSSYRDHSGRSINVPMLSKEAIMGIMSITSAAGGQITDAQARVLESVASLTAIALEKGKLYEETIRISHEIQQRNKELDDFTYVVSHDLKEPLISVEGFSRILQSDYGGVIQAEGREYLDSIVAASTRMKGLIDDLLMLSRMSRPMEAFKMVQVKSLIDEITADMEFTIRQKKVRMIVPADLPSVYGNETQLKVLFRNLIGNAVKFTDRPDPVVEIGFHNGENNSYLFSVRDNGIGIEPEFFEKIFVIFQRLHPRELYEGSGAGLAIVKKIMERHGGRVWVESELGKGSTFYLSFPASGITGT